MSESDMERYHEKLKQSAMANQNYLNNVPVCGSVRDAVQPPIPTMEHAVKLRDLASAVRSDLSHLTDMLEGKGEGHNLRDSNPPSCGLPGVMQETYNLLASTSIAVSHLRSLLIG